MTVLINNVYYGLRLSAQINYYFYIGLCRNYEPVVMNSNYLLLQL